ncbi:Lytic transglycosylase catalytic [Syntrophobotulus glycolicus DSM 8271]|uniref:Lytic transglycosylase catalytic n=1 Tax=Syntrophobotulus glycolicus (strain DSM 8271 / FlGlyR) TaxID=645991 RepID=F0T2Q3_SYNGF|nr:lytic transglycosylase domain-containing protein [Syntrophobotulus glycolicus]ADY56452.1 Lytic transglycosylase catalytic [Syntrophobotulus glycolicus DSM 8271]
MAGVVQGVLKNKTKSSILGLVLVLTILVAQSNLIPKLFYPYPYKQIINKYAIEYNTDSLLVVSVIKAESSFLPFSSSDKGAIGLMQLMPDTAREISQKLGEDYAAIDLKDPETNIRYGSMYLAGLSKQYDGNTVLTLAAYNAGSGRVKEWLKTTGLGLDNYSVKDIPFPETRTYVEKVLKYHQEYSKLY